MSRGNFGGASNTNSIATGGASGLGDARGWGSDHGSNPDPTSGSVSSARAQAWELYFGLPEPKAAQDPYSNYERSLRTYEDAFKGRSRFLEEVILTFFSWAKQFPIRRLLPWTENSSGLEFEWDTWHFGDHMLTDEPPLSVPRLISSSVSKGRASLKRHGIGMVLGWEFYNTARGRLAYKYHLFQIINAVLFTMNLNVFLALLNPAWDSLPPQFRFNKFSNPTNLRRYVTKYLDEWGAIHKKPGAIDHWLSGAQEDMRARIGRVANCLVLPSRTLRFAAADPRLTDKIFVPAPKSDASGGNEPLVSKDGNLTIFESYPLPNGVGVPPIDPLYSVRRICSFTAAEVEHVMHDTDFKTEHMDISVYDENSDSWAPIRYRRGVEMSGLFHTQASVNRVYLSSHTKPKIGSRTSLGADFFKGETSWGSFMDKTGVMEKWVKTLLSRPEELEKFVDQFGTRDAGHLNGRSFNETVEENKRFAKTREKSFLDGSILIGEMDAAGYAAAASASAATGATAATAALPPPPPSPAVLGAVASIVRIHAIARTNTNPHVRRLAVLAMISFAKRSAADVVATAVPFETALTKFISKAEAETKSTEPWTQGHIMSYVIPVLNKLTGNPSAVPYDLSSATHKFQTYEYGADAKLYRISTTGTRVGLDLPVGMIGVIGRFLSGAAVVVTADDRKALEAFSELDDPPLHLSALQTMVRTYMTAPSASPRMDGVIPWWTTWEGALAEIATTADDAKLEFLLDKTRTILTTIGGPASTRARDTGLNIRAPPSTPSYRRLASHGYGKELDAVYSLRVGNPGSDAKLTADEFENLCAMLCVAMERFESLGVLPDIGTTIVSVAIAQFYDDDGKTANVAGVFLRELKKRTPAGSTATLAMKNIEFVMSIVGSLLVLAQFLLKESPSIEPSYYKKKSAAEAKVRITTADGVLGTDGDDYVSFDRAFGYPDRRYGASVMGVRRTVTRKSQPSFKAGSPGAHEAVKAMLNSVPLDFTFLKWSMDHDQWPLLNMLYLRFPQYMTGTPLLVCGDGVAGSTLHQQQNFMVSVNTAQEILNCHYSLWAKSIIVQAQAVMHWNNAAIREYHGGNGTEFMDPLDQSDVQDFQNNDSGKDIIAIPMRTDESIYKNSMLSTTGAWHPDMADLGGVFNGPLHYSHARAASKHWGFDQPEMHPLMTPKFDDSPNQAQTTLSFRDHHFVYGTTKLVGTAGSASDGINKPIRSKGHFDHIYPGVGETRRMARDYVVEQDYNMTSLGRQAI